MLGKELLKEIIESQRKWILTVKTGIKREKLQEIKIRKTFVLVVSGIRRCGKSTFLNQVSKLQRTFYYLNLEDPRLNGFELNDFNRVDEIFKELYGKGGVYFFDEIQNIKQWEKFIRYIADKGEKIMITGSNASLLSRELGTRLTGRHLTTELFPFSYREFLSFLNLNPSFESYEKFLFKGGFPEYLGGENVEILNELLNDVLMRDIAVKFGIKNTQILKKLAIYLITSVGKEFSYNKLKKIFNIKSVQTCIDYISYFEDAYLVFSVPKFSYSYKKQQISPKKIYSIDNGFSSANSFSFSKDKGKMLENSVFLELRKKYKNIFYFQEENECDFIIKYREKIIKAIQVCYDLNEDNKTREINGLRKAMKKFNLNQGIILTFNQEDEINVDEGKILILPVWKWMAKKK